MKTIAILAALLLASLLRAGLADVLAGVSTPSEAAWDLIRVVTLAPARLLLSISPVLVPAVLAGRLRRRHLADGRSS